MSATATILKFSDFASFDFIEPTGTGFHSVSLCRNVMDDTQKAFYFTYDEISTDLLKHHQKAIFEHTQRHHELREVYQILLDELGGQPVISGYVGNFADVQALTGSNGNAASLAEQLMQINLGIGTSNEPRAKFTDELPW